MIEKARFYKPSELAGLHPYFDRYKGSLRTTLYDFIKNNLKYTQYKTTQGKVRFQIEGKAIIQFLKDQDLI